MRQHFMEDPKKQKDPEEKPQGFLNQKEEEAVCSGEEKGECSEDSFPVASP